MSDFTSWKQNRHEWKINTIQNDIHQSGLLCIHMREKWALLANSTQKGRELLGEPQASHCV